LTVVESLFAVLEVSRRVAEGIGKVLRTRKK
jgi:hypothetical protein